MFNLIAIFWSNIIDEESQKSIKFDDLWTKTVLMELNFNRKLPAPHTSNRQVKIFTSFAWFYSHLHIAARKQRDTEKYNSFVSLLSIHNNNIKYNIS